MWRVLTRLSVGGPLRGDGSGAPHSTDLSKCSSDHETPEIRRHIHGASAALPLTRR